ncbi:MAG: PadR family transcriptional regulator, partial [Microbacterium sp. 14-71-5]
LALLHQEEAYGGEIVDRLAAFPGLAISAGTAYPLLSRLKRSGLIASVWRESPVGPPRKYYRLTADGEESFADLARAWNGMKNDMDQLLGTDVAP